MIETLIKSKKRVGELGEVFTPSWLVEEILDHLPEKLFEDPSRPFIDPMCGNGNFLSAVVKRKIANGLSPQQALETTYGIDIMLDNILECRQRLTKIVITAMNSSVDHSSPEIGKDILLMVENNIRHGDTLKFELEDIFSDEPSEELINFRNEKQDFITLDSTG